MSYFLDVDEELGQAVEDEFAFVDENVDLVLEELLAIFKLGREYLS